MTEIGKDTGNKNVSMDGSPDNKQDWFGAEYSYLSEMEKRYLGLLHNLEAGIVIHAPDTSLKANNPKAVELLGLSNEQLQGKLAIDPQWNFVNEKCEPLPIDLYPVNMLGKDQKDFRKKVFGVIRPLTSDLVWLEVGGFVINDTQGEVYELVIYFIDITEKRKVENAFKMSEEKFSTAFHSAPFTITISELYSGKFVDTNEAFTQEIGYSKELAFGKTSIELGLWVNSYEREEAVSILKEGKAILGREYLFRKKNGEQIIGSYTAKVFNIEGASFVLSIMDNISEQKLAKEEIKNKNIELIRLNEAKDKFFSIVSHDLRGPINGFLTLTQILSEDLKNLTTEEIHSIILSMKNSAKNLFRLMENVLQWSRIQNGTFPFLPEALLLDKLIEECVHSVFDQANLKGIQIEFHITSELKIVADKNMLLTVFRNLLSNGIKFSKPGDRVTIIGKQTKDNFIEIIVEDSGIGMNEITKNNLFTINSQKSRKGTNGEPSSGLGLVLCKEFIEKHNGRIWVKSEVDKGSHFFVVLPTSTQ